MTTKPKDLENMANLLKQGATLTEHSCPACASPLFKLKTGELWCAKCQKRVIIVKQGETPQEATKPIVLDTLESTVLAKIQEIETQIRQERDPAQLEKLSATLAMLLGNLEKIKKMKHWLHIAGRELKLLGRYDNFPTSTQAEAKFVNQAPLATLQQAIVQVLHALNNQTTDMRTITRASLSNCCVNFEFGVADGDAFNFIDTEEREKISIALAASPVETLDFYCAIRYHVIEPEGKRRPLKFDYKMLRFTFEEKSMILTLYHERGNQNMPIEDLVNFIGDQVNEQLVKREQPTIALRKLTKSQNLV